MVQGLPIPITDAIETTSLGAGMLALTGSGVVDAVEDAVSLTTHVVETRQPDPKTSALHHDDYQLYRAMYSSLLSVFERASSIRS